MWQWSSPKREALIPHREWVVERDISGQRRLRIKPYRASYCLELAVLDNRRISQKHNTGTSEELTDPARQRWWTSYGWGIESVPVGF